MEKTTEDKSEDRKPDDDGFAAASFRFHQELAKLHQTVNGLSQKPQSGKPGKTLPLLALVVSVLSLSISAYNAYTSSRTLGNQAIQLINDLATLTPTDTPKVGQTGVAVSSDNATYDYKVNEIINLLNVSTENSISKKMYLKLIRSAIAFKDTAHARKFLNASDNATEDDHDSVVQLALAWAQLADLTKIPDDVGAALKHLMAVLPTAEQDVRAQYQVQFDLIDIYILQGRNEDLLEAEAYLTKARATLDKIGLVDKVYADQFRPALADFEKKIIEATKARVPRKTTPSQTLTEPPKAGNKKP